MRLIIYDMLFAPLTQRAEYWNSYMLASEWPTTDLTTFRTLQLTCKQLANETKLYFDAHFLPKVIMYFADMPSLVECNDKVMKANHCYHGINICLRNSIYQGAVAHQSEGAEAFGLTDLGDINLAISLFMSDQLDNEWTLIAAHCGLLEIQNGALRIKAPLPLDMPADFLEAIPFFRTSKRGTRLLDQFVHQTSENGIAVVSYQVHGLGLDATYSVLFGPLNHLYWWGHDTTAQESLQCMSVGWQDPVSLHMAKLFETEP